MTARQPGEAAKMPRSARKRGRRGDETAQPTAAFLDLPPQDYYAQGERSLGKTTKKTAAPFEVLLKGGFSGTHDFWTEYLCQARNADGSITLSSRARQILAEAGPYRAQDWLPATINRKRVHGFRWRLCGSAKDFCRTPAPPR